MSMRPASAPAFSPAFATLRRRPAVVVDAAAGGAWAVLAAMSPAMGAGYGARLGMWTLMCVAMMLPTAEPAVHHTARNTLAWRRGRAVIAFVAVYLGIWAAYGAVALAVAGPLAPASTGALATVLLVAACWELTPLKRRALRACHRSVPLAPRGWRATRSVIRFGLRNGCACVASCWAIMLVMAVVASHALAWMVVLAAIVAAQKLLPRPDRTTRAAAATLAGAAGLVLLLTS